MKVTAVVERDGHWWAVEVPEVPGVYTQVRRLDQVSAMVCDALALWFELPESEFVVTVVTELGDGTTEQLAIAREERQRAKDLAASASEKFRAIARALHDDGLPERDIGTIVGVSHQRANQLLKEGVK